MEFKEKFKLWLSGVYAGFLTLTEKMPCASWSIPAWKSCPTGRKVSKTADFICKICYARKGRYLFKNVENAQRARKAFVLWSLRKDGGKDFVATMIAAINKTKINLFRIHDAGDMFSVPYLKAWMQICKSLPNIRFRCPTREWYTDDKALRNLLEDFALLPNVVVQPSALKLNDAPPNQTNFGAGTTVITPDNSFRGDYYICPATRKDRPNSCAENDCYLCWDKKNKRGIAYLRH
jgi:hypothetical protein